MGCPDIAEQSIDRSTGKDTDADQRPTLAAIKAAIERAEQEQAARARALHAQTVARARPEPEAVLDKAPLAQAAARQRLDHYST
ncbi:MAG: hypothetical protein IRY96_08830, partial [Burkholderiales bacterium]|nr:hypothetical protein [Burkholderiales bacterium]